MRSSIINIGASCTLFLPHGVTSSTFGTPLYSQNFGIPGTNASYDYVVIGGGTAGAALASRLAEDRSLTVALVEAGGFYEQENGNETLVPGCYQPNTHSPSINWNFKTTPQPQLDNLTLTYARGKTLGGSSALNAMLYQRGTNGSYQAWADAVGDQSYNFANFLQFFDKSANYTPPNIQTRAANASVPAPGPKAYSTSGGPLHVSHPNTAMPFASWGQLGLRAIGIPDIEDFSSGALIGHQYCPLTVRPEDQTRSSSQASYLEASFARNLPFPNLSVYIHTLGSKILFNANKTATGVLVKSNGMPFFLSAKKEVIVSAGAFQSPQLLMVSGIGPSSELKKHNITVISDLPGVGQNMWDHVLFPVSHEVNVSTTSILSTPSLASTTIQSYNLNQIGILTTNNADYLGWEKIPQNYYSNLSSTVKKDLSTFPADWPNLEHVVLGFNPVASLAVDKNYGTLQPAIITPLSRGSIGLSSASADDAPLINVGWLSSPTDLETAIIGIKRAREFWASEVMQSVVIGEEAVPGRNVSTDKQIGDWCKRNVQTVYHASCTCKMGRANDTMAVTDSRARVFGVKGLRVVDASTFPLLPPGHPQSTIYALAEKIAYHILTRS